MLFRKDRDAPSWSAIDIHSHVLPGLDDGAKDLADTVSMLRIAAAEGISDMIVTPHFHLGRHIAPPGMVLRTLERVQQIAETKRIPIRLYPGSEVYNFDDMVSSLKRKDILTMNGSDFVLVEFSPAVMFRTMQNAMDGLLNEGYQPILAHVERYECLLKDTDSVFFLHDMGVRIQVNASTVTGKNGADGKRFVHRLLQGRVVDHIGTDAHGHEHRTPEMAQCRKTIEKKYGDDYAYQILRGNAEEILYP